MEGVWDSRAFNLINSDKYEKPISKQQWKSAFDDWLEYDLAKREKTRVTVKEVSILFYQYLYTHTLTAYEELSGTKFDIEHLIPIEPLKKLAGEGGLPISAFPNLCLLDEALNRSKGDLTYYQFYENERKKGELTEEQISTELAKVEKFTFSSRADLSFVVDDFSPEAYFSFLKRRYVVVTDKFYELYGIS